MRPVAWLLLILMLPPTLGQVTEVPVVPGTVELLPGFEHVTLGGLVGMRVTFARSATGASAATPVTVESPSGDRFTLTARLSSVGAGDREVRCIGDVSCIYAFPDDFPDAHRLFDPHEWGTYRVSAQNDPEPPDTFHTHHSSPLACQEQLNVENGQVVSPLTHSFRLVVTGFQPGQAVTMEFLDQTTGEVLQRTTTQMPVSSFFVTTPFRFDPRTDAHRFGHVIRVTVQASGQAVTRIESFRLGGAEAVLAAIGDMPNQTERTQLVTGRFRAVFPSAPVGCTPNDALFPHISASDPRFILPLLPLASQTVNVGPDGDGTTRVVVDVERVAGDPLNPVQIDRETTVSARYVAQGVWQANWTSEPDLPPTIGGAPQYRFTIRDGQLLESPAWPNEARPRLQGASFTAFNVTIAHLAPRPSKLLQEYERLDAVDINFTVRYHDGTSLTDEEFPTLETWLRSINGTRNETHQAGYIGNGTWNVHRELAIDDVPLGAHVLTVLERQDQHGNVVNFTNLGPFLVGPARPRLTIETLKEQEGALNNTRDVQRTETITVRVTARFRDGVPLTPANADPETGGVSVRLVKRQGLQLVSSEPVPVNHVGAGVWSTPTPLAIPIDARDAPEGRWSVEVTARDRLEPANVNASLRVLNVSRALMRVTFRETPPPALDVDLHLAFHLNYPDGAPVTTRHVDIGRGQAPQAQLQRFTIIPGPAGGGGFFGFQTIRNLALRPVDDGQLWTAVLNITEVPQGLYRILLTGDDVHGNIVRAASTAFFTRLFEDVFRNATNPFEPAYARGDVVVAVFPAAEGDQNVNITLFWRRSRLDPWIAIQENTRIGLEEAGRLGLGNTTGKHVALFRSGTDTPLGDYEFVLTGRDADRVPFLGFSPLLELVAVEVSRAIVVPPPAEVDRGSLVRMVIEAKPGDVALGARVEHGDGTVTTVPVERETGRFRIEWTPGARAPPGLHRLLLTGRDAHGNTFEVRSAPVRLLTLYADVAPETVPEAIIPRGSIASYRFRVIYETGELLNRSAGTPSVEVRGAISGPAAVRFIDGAWQASYRVPANAPEGEYRFRVSGRDVQGNLIRDHDSQAYRPIPGTIDLEPDAGPGESQRRGDVIIGVFTTPAPILPETVRARAGVGTTLDENVTATVEGNRVTVRWRTARDTPIAQWRVGFQAQDTLGNTIQGSTGRFLLRPQNLQVNFQQRQDIAATPDDEVIMRAQIRYPDGSLLTPREGTPVPGLVTPSRGLVGTLTPEFDAATGSWEVRFRVPTRPESNIYQITFAGIDRWQNTVQPLTSPPIRLVNPLVPDYLPTPVSAPFLLLAVLAAALSLAMVSRRRSR